MTRVITAHGIVVAAAACALFALLAAPTSPAASHGALAGEEFVGPFASWSDVRARYGARGDGVADDTAALQRALDEVGTAGESPVVWLPAGTYRITATLRLKGRQHISILGEDPELTTIRWDGPAGGDMLAVNGVAQSRYGRLTWDGAGRAGAAYNLGWENREDFFPTGNEHVDEVFRDLEFGIRAGTSEGGEAETAVVRCKFVRLSKAGLSLENFNALDWWVWHSLFEDTQYGVTNLYGAGGFFVYDSVFLRSREADVAIGNTMYFSVRRSYSRGSNAFFGAGPIGSAPAQISLQDNVVLDSGSTPITIRNPGPLLLLDNVVRGPSPAVAIVEPYLDNPASADVVALGNTYAQASPYQVAGRLRSVDDAVGAAIPDRPPPTLPATPRSQGRRVFEPVGGDIQAAIDAAVASGAPRPVVHLPHGVHAVAATLTVPGGSDVQLVGDGMGATQLVWARAGGGPVLQLRGPSRATLRDLSIAGGGAVDGIWVEAADQPGGRLVAHQLNVNDSRVGLLVDGVRRAAVELRNLEHGGNAEASVRLTRGARAAIFGGASSLFGGVGYDLRDGAGLVIHDMWYEGSTGATYLGPGGSGSFVLDGGMIADTGQRPFDTSNFAGSVALVNVGLGTPNTIVGGDHFLALGIVGVAEPFVTLRGAPAAAWHSKTQGLTTGGSAPRAEAQVGVADPAAFLRDRLAPLRAARPAGPDSAPVPPGATEVQLHRVSAAAAQVALGLFADTGHVAPRPTAISSSPALNQVISSSPEQTTVGATVIVTWSGIAEPMNGWIGLYPDGAPDVTGEVGWFFPWSCSKENAGTAEPAGSCPFDVPDDLPAGRYQFRWMGDGPTGHEHFLVTAGNVFVVER